MEMTNEQLDFGPDMETCQWTGTALKEGLPHTALISEHLVSNQGVVKTRQDGVGGKCCFVNGD